MSIDEVIEKALFDYCLAWRDRSYAIQDRIELGLRAAIEQHVAEEVAKEREACAKACESQSARWFRDHSRMYVSYECAAAIRARAEKETK